MRPVRLGLTIVAALLILMGAWVAWQAWQVSRSLSAAADDAQALQSALTDGDNEVVDSELGDLQEHTKDARDRTSGTTWSLLTHVPAFGDDARGARLVSRTLADLSSGGLEPLVDSASDLESFLPINGRVPIEPLEGLKEPVERADAAFAKADKDLESQDPSGFVGPFRDKYRQLSAKVSDASKTLAAANTALQVMPSMLGADGPRNYLLVFQNNAEIRATGGLPGAVSLLHADNGELTLTRQVAGADFGEAPKPVLPLTSAERQLYGNQLGTFFLDANFTPDFPRAAALWKAHWEQTYPDRIDGVIALDPVALSYLLEATGPVQAGDTTLTADNAVDELLHQTYLRYPDPAAQDEHFRQIAQAVFTAVTAGGKQPRSMLEALQRAADEHRLYLHSFLQHEDDVLSGTAVEGSLVTDPGEPPQVSVSLNDTTGAKMSYFLRFSVRVSSTSCLQSVQNLSGEAHLESLAPTDAATSLPTSMTGGGAYGIPPGAQLVAVRLHAPAGGSIGRVTLNSDPLKDAEVVDQDGRQVLTVYVYLDPQRTSDLTWTMKTGSGQTGDVDVSVTPGITHDQTSSVTTSAC